MFRVLKINRSGFYAWLHEPLSLRAKANEVLMVKIRESYVQSMGYAAAYVFL
jgi:putative transposase